MKKSYILALLTFLVLTLNVEGAESTACPGNAWPGAMSYLSQDEDVNSIIEKAQEAYNKGNHVEAVRLYRIAAERGNSLAQYRLGTRYFRGEGVNKSNERHSSGGREPQNRETLTRRTTSEGCMPRGLG